MEKERYYRNLTNDHLMQLAETASKEGINPIENIGLMLNLAVLRLSDIADELAFQGMSGSHLSSAIYGMTPEKIYDLLYWLMFQYSGDKLKIINWIANGFDDGGKGVRKEEPDGERNESRETEDEGTSRDEGAESC